TQPPVGLLDEDAAILAGADEGLVAQLHRGVQRLEGVGAAVTDVHPNAALRGRADPLEAMLPQDRFPLATLALGAGLSTRGGSAWVATPCVKGRGARGR